MSNKEQPAVQIQCSLENNNLTPILLNSISQLQNTITQLQKEQNELLIENQKNYTIIKQKEEELLILRENNTKLLEEIDILKKENYILKSKIAELEKQIKEQNTTIAQQNKSINDLEEKVKDLQNKNDKENYKKFLVAIQDLNSIYQFEQNKDIFGKNNIKNLRNFRNGSCHFINDDDDDYIVFKKKEYIIQKLSTIDNETKLELDELCKTTDFTKNIIKYVQPILHQNKNTVQNINNITQKDIDKIFAFFWE
jgi:predicted RNase H-like nuclease (RuvC/YqgF family)